MASTAPTSRREARERALEILYEAKAKGAEPAEVLADLGVVPDSYAIRLVEGVGKRVGEIDALIASHAIGWATERMPVVDLLVCRMAVYELLCEPSVPAAVVLSEAVELASRFSTEESGHYVNGLLASVASEVRKGQAC